MYLSTYCSKPLNWDLYPLYLFYNIPILPSNTPPPPPPFSAKLEGVHKEFQKAVGAIVCNYVPEKGALSLISRTDATQKRASMIQNMHFRNISQKAMLLKRTEEAVKQLESTKLHSTGG